MNARMRGTIAPLAGDRLPQLLIEVTRKMIIAGATGSRDWQPQHHDKEAAQHAGLPDIIMNNYTQAGLISRYVTDWSGPIGRIGRLRFSMRRPICPDSRVHFSGQVVSVEEDGDQIAWIQLDVAMKQGDTLLTSAAVRLAMPADASARSPWRCPPGEWRP